MIYFLSLSPYPTTKAYGVTLKNTIEAAIEYGLPAKIIAPNKLYPSTYLEMLLNWILQLLRHAYRERWIIRGKVAFYLHRYFFQLYLRKYLIDNKNDVIWVRDVRLAYFFFKKSKKSIVLEIHQVPNQREIHFLKKFSDRVIIAPISLHIMNAIQSDTPNKKLTLLPMGVPDYFFHTAASKNKAKFKIGYFGSYRSSGHFQGVEEMLKSLLPIFKSDTEFNVLLAGVGDEGFHALTKIAINLGIQNQLSIVKHIDHLLVPIKMQECMALIIPYPEGPYFASRFPIKAMEYASVKVPIICSNTKSLRNIFAPSEVWFYNFEEDKSLISTVTKIMQFPSEATQKSELAFQKALNFTYRNRIKKIDERLKYNTQKSSNW